jgi:hypothetical protein
VFAVEKKEVSRCAREEDQVLFLLDIFYCFFLSKRNSWQETGRGAWGNRTARDQERRGMAAVGDGGGRLGLKDNKKKTKKRTQVTSNN